MQTEEIRPFGDSIDIDLIIMELGTDVNKGFKTLGYVPSDHSVSEKDDRTAKKKSKEDSVPTDKNEAK